MLRKFLCSASLAGFLFAGIAAHARPIPQQESQPKQRNEQNKSASGKVTDIASDKKSFTLEITDGSAKHTMQSCLTATRKSKAKSAWAPMPPLSFSRLQTARTWPS